MEPDSGMRDASGVTDLGSLVADSQIFVKNVPAHKGLYVFFCYLCAQKARVPQRVGLSDLLTDNRNEA